MRLSTVEQGTEEWHEERLAKVGGTRLKKILTAKGLKLSSTRDSIKYAIVDENFTGISADSVFKSEAMERGNDLEPDAREAYIKATGNNIVEYGFCLSDNINILGLSPDGFTDDLKGAIEIKCPGGAEHLSTIEFDQIPDQYTLQVCNYFVVNEVLEWLDFVSYRPEFYPRQIHIVRVTRDELKDKIEIITDQLTIFDNEVSAMIEKYEF